MSINNEKWLGILKKANVELTDSIIEGEITEVKVSSDGKNWLISVRLPLLLPVDEVFNLMDKITKYVKGIIPILEHVAFSFEYNNFIYNEELVKAYLQRGISECARSHKNVKVLEFYTKEFLKNRINIY